MSKVIVAYIPVFHEGYRKFFSDNSDAKMIYLLGKSFQELFVPLAKDIRALDSELMKKIILALDISKDVQILEIDDFKMKNWKGVEVIVPNDEIMREICSTMMSGIKVSYSNIFLRWDKHKSSEGKKVEVDQVISKEKFDKEVIASLKENAEKNSSDWWRRVGAALIKDKKIILESYNHHVPSDHTPYVNGDPRSDFHKGVNLELSTAIHAEASLIAESARKGIALEGASMYVTTFPCPPCAKQVAYSGIKKLYYSGGYGVLDGESILKSKGVEIIYVESNG